MVDVPVPGAIYVGAAVTCDRDADGMLVTVTVAVCAIGMPFAVAETVRVPVVVALSVPVATPLASVRLDGWVIVFPLPLAASTTAAPLTGWPAPSLAVTVIVVVCPPAEIVVGAALNPDCAPD